MEATAATTVPSGTLDNWFRRLKDDRLEVCVRAKGVKLRASGPEEHVWKLVEAFEEQTGVAVEGEWRRPPRTGARPLAGQLTLGEEPGGQD